jgi:mannose-6-phosphate isomerase-like protein (cupin superfamily)
VPEEIAATQIEPGPGEVKWVAAMWPAGAGPLATARPGVDQEGFHTTRTVDFVYLLSGELTLVLDRESVRIQAGDCVVQQVVHHAWRNDSAEPAVLLAWAHAPARPATS